MRKKKVRINNESLEIVVCAEDKNDFTGALFKNYMIFVLAPVNYFRQFGDTIWTFLAATTAHIN